MRIIDTRHETPDDYEIKGVVADIDVFDDGSRRHVYTSVRVSLEPRLYKRNRFDGNSSFEKKKHGARQLIISDKELQQMVGVLREELGRCYLFLEEHHLLGEYHSAQKKTTESAASSA
jgi:hypothetical protein